MKILTAFVARPAAAALALATAGCLAPTVPGTTDAGSVQPVEFSTVVDVDAVPADELVSRAFAYAGPVLSKQVHGNVVQFRVRIACETVGMERALVGSREYSADATFEARDGRYRLTTDNITTFYAGTGQTMTLGQVQASGNPHDCRQAFDRFAADLAAFVADAAQDW